MKVPADLKRKARAYAKKQYCNADCKDPRIKWAMEITEQDFIAGYMERQNEVYAFTSISTTYCQPPINQDVELMGGGK